MEKQRYEMDVWVYRSYSILLHMGFTVILKHIVILSEVMGQEEYKLE